MRQAKMFHVVHGVDSTLVNIHYLLGNHPGTDVEAVSIETEKCHNEGSEFLEQI
jgi:hypothetical protein